MGTTVLRSQDCLQQHLPTKTTSRNPNPSPPHHGRTPPNAKPSRKSNSPPSRRSPPSNPKSTRNNTGNGDSNTSTRAGRRRARIAGEMVEKFPAKNLVMGEVTILKRGDARRPDPEEKVVVADAVDVDDELILFSTDEMGPDPKILPKNIRPADRKPAVYAGAGFFTSPSPSSLPFPTSLFAKKQVSRTTTDLATQSIRYLLRLDLP